MSDADHGWRLRAVSSSSVRDLRSRVSTFSVNDPRGRTERSIFVGGGVDGFAPCIPSPAASLRRGIIRDLWLSAWLSDRVRPESELVS